MPDALDIFRKMLEDEVAAGDPNLEARKYWRAQGRPEQHTPDWAFNVWLILAGRGFGKTRTGAEDMADYMLSNPGVRCAILAPTIADARDTCVEGESGLLAVLARYGFIDGENLDWNKSKLQLKLPNGSQVKLFSAESPARLRGPQHHRAWVDELAQVVKRDPDAWAQLRFGLRLGKNPQIVCTTTPLPVKAVRDLIKRAGEDVHVTRGSTFDNAANLAENTLAALKEEYEGTRLGRQELYAEMLDDIPGALWQRDWFDKLRLRRMPEMTQVVVAVDPAVTSGDDADETGILVVGKGIDGRYYVLADRSCRTTPMDWAARVVGAYEDFGANQVVIETNQGGDALVALLRQLAPNLPVVKIHAKKGKRVRAEPVSALYEQGKVSHVGEFDTLEDQLCLWTPEEVESPDRMDALVYGLLQLSTTGLAAGFLNSLMTRTGG